MDANYLRYILALISVPKVGAVLAKNLIAYCGSPEAVFKEKKTHLLKIPGVGAKISAEIAAFKDFAEVDKELAFIEKHKIKTLYYLNDDYPARLKDAMEGPVLLFYRGQADLNAARVLGIVGTRKNTDYGRAVTEELVAALAGMNIIIVSGLAFGIDAIAHKAALQHQLPTVGVMGTGLDVIYPADHRNLAARMLENGGLLTEYVSGTRADREHFPARNRIVAGMVDGLVVVETALKGGALITANIASSYHRELFAVPGRNSDEFSQGCNHLIKTNKAFLVESADDITYQLGWGKPENPAPSRSERYQALPPAQQKIVEVLRQHDRVDLDNLSHLLDVNLTELSMALLEMEFGGVVQALPGKFFRLA